MPNLVEKSRAFFLARKERLTADIAVQTKLIEQRHENINEVRAAQKEQGAVFLYQRTGQDKRRSLGEKSEQPDEASGIAAPSG